MCLTFEENFYPMFFLQVDTTAIAQGTERFFQTSPDTVYGLLTGALALAVVAMWLQNRSLVKDLIDINTKNVEVLTVLVSKLDGMREASQDGVQDVKDFVNNAREQLLLKIDNLAASFLGKKD
jgi:hypothetical protein